MKSKKPQGLSAMLLLLLLAVICCCCNCCCSSSSLDIPKLTLDKGLHKPSSIAKRTALGTGLLDKIIGTCSSSSCSGDSCRRVRNIATTNSRQKLIALRGGKKKKVSTGAAKKTTSSKSSAKRKKKSRKTAEKEESAVVDEEAVESSSSTDDIIDNDDDDDESDLFADQQQHNSGSGVPAVKFIADIWEKTPPLTQCYVGSSILLTLLCFILNKNQWPEFLNFDWQRILLRGQLWRVATAFLFFGALDPFYPLTMQFVWQHMAQLEKLNYAKPEEFLVMILFGAASLISLYSFTGISMKFLGHNLATYLVYIWSRVFEGADVNFMDLLTLKAEMLPWFFCLQTFLLEQEIPLADLIGIAVGHVYHYLQGKQLLKAPSLLRNWFASPLMTKRYARFRNDFE